MAMPASSTAAQPTTYVTLRNPSVLQQRARIAWTTCDHSRHFVSLEYIRVLYVIIDCLLDQRLVGLLEGADMPTPLI